MPSVNLGVRKTDIPYFGAWLGHWAIESRFADGIRVELESLDLRAHLAGRREDDDAPKKPKGLVALSRGDLQAALDLDEEAFALIDGVAIVNVRGPLTKHASSWGGTCSTVMLRRTLRECESNAAVKGIMLVAETPGGTVSGMHELAADIESVTKPTLCYCNDLTASAGYWAASQCDEISANAPALVGSIGTYCVVADYKAAYDKAGVLIHVVKAGAHKGDFTAGTEITEAQIADLQREIDQINAFFLDAVSRGRGFDAEKLATLADGRAHVAADALALGLIDNVESFDAAFERFSTRINGAGSVGANFNAADESIKTSANDTEPETMAESPKPATLAEIQAACPKASARFHATCVEKMLAIEEVKSAYINFLEAQSVALAAEAKGTKGVKPNQTKIKGKKKRAEDKKECEDEEEPMAEDDEEEMDDEEETSEDSQEEEEDDVVARWNAAMSRELKACKGNRQRAFKQVCAKNPGLREAYVEATNAQSQRARRANAELAERERRARARVANRR